MLLSEKNCFHTSTLKSTKELSTKLLFRFGLITNTVFDIYTHLTFSTKPLMEQMVIADIVKYSYSYIPQLFSIFKGTSTSCLFF